MSLSDALQSSYRAFMGGRELKGAFLDGVERSWGQVEVARNLFTNPNLVGDGTYATVAENLFTNPNLVGDGTWAEVRRNLCTDPALTTTTGKIVTRVSSTVSGGVLTATVSEVGFYPRVAVVPSTGAGGLPVTAGDTIAVSAKREAGDIAIRIAYYSSSNSVVATVDPSVFVSDGVASSITTVPAEAVKAIIEVCTTSSQAVGYQFAFSEVLIEKSSVLGPYLDGNTTPETAVGVVQPEDFRWRWLGAENASESVMEIERVRGLLSTANTVAGVSTRSGQPAVRVIATSASNNDSRSYFIIPTAARSRGTAVATAHIDAPQPSGGTLWARRLRVIAPESVYPPIPNEPGVYPQKVTFGPLDNTFWLQLSNGGVQGSGDVWWTDIGLYVGNYTGGAFSGDTAPEDIEGLVQPEDFRIRWSGAVNNSTSVMEIERVRGLTPFGNSVAGVSTRDGKPAARMIPLSTSTATYAAFTIPAIARASGTVVGTLHLDAPITGPVNTIAVRTVDAEVPRQGSDQPPNEAGSYLLRSSYSDLSSPFRVRLWHGGAQGSGDVWWTGIGLFAGEYDGEAFSGDTPDYGRDTYTWDGERNNSPSIYRRYE